MNNIEDLTPIKERAACLKKYWGEFDAIHADQIPATGSLWGLTEDKEDKVFDHKWLPYQRELYRKFLSADLITEIERLWGTSLLRKYPDRIVTEPFPHMVMAKAAGPALSFWHSVSLTAWFLTQGPRSVTDMSGLAEHQHKNLSKLEQLGTPIDPVMFEELIEIEERFQILFEYDEDEVLYEDELYLDPEDDFDIDEESSEPENIAQSSFIEEARNLENKTQSGFDDSIKTEDPASYIEDPAYDKAFEQFRDVISRHRRLWTQRNFDLYLTIRWQSEIGQSIDTYLLKKSGRKSGKPPAPKQFASLAEIPIKHWLGGNISYLYTALGETAPFEPQYRSIMPKNSAGFIRKVAELLFSQNLDRSEYPAKELIEDYNIKELARKALNYIQIHEAADDAPTLKDFSAKFKQNSTRLHSDIERAWEIYETAIKEALRQSR